MRGQCSVQVYCLLKRHLLPVERWRRWKSSELWFHIGRLQRRGLLPDMLVESVDLEVFVRA